jgi:hypothetical protein
VTSGLSRLNEDQIPERGARMARRDDREYREYLREKQRRQPGCPARKVVLDQLRQATLPTFVAIALLACAWPDAALAQPRQGRFEIGAQLTSTTSGEFDQGDIGVGGRFSWHPAHPAALVGIEAEIDRYPSDFPDRQPFSRGRTEGLFGVTVGPRLDRLRPFAKLRPGFVRFQEAPHPFACILIFPPPLACALASGQTVFALDIGGGVELFTTRKTFVRVEGGDRLLKYPGPVFDSSRMAEDNGFFSHDFRFAIGGGLRF